MPPRRRFKRRRANRTRKRLRLPRRALFKAKKAYVRKRRQRIRHKRQRRIPRIRTQRLGRMNPDGARAIAEYTWRGQLKEQGNTASTQYILARWNLNVPTDPWGFETIDDTQLTINMTDTRFNAGGDFSKFDYMQVKAVKISLRIDSFEPNCPLKIAFGPWAQMYTTDAGLAGINTTGNDDFPFDFSNAALRAHFFARTQVPMWSKMLQFPAMHPGYRPVKIKRYYNIRQLARKMMGITPTDTQLAMQVVAQGETLPGREQPANYGEIKRYPQFLPRFYLLIWCAQDIDALLRNQMVTCKIKYYTKFSRKGIQDTVEMQDIEDGGHTSAGQKDFVVPYFPSTLIVNDQGFLVGDTFPLPVKVMGGSISSGQVSNANPFPVTEPI